MAPSCRLEAGRWYSEICDVYLKKNGVLTAMAAASDRTVKTPAGDLATTKAQPAPPAPFVRRKTS